MITARAHRAAGSPSLGDGRLVTHQAGWSEGCRAVAGGHLSSARPALLPPQVPLLAMHGTHDKCTSMPAVKRLVRGESAASPPAPRPVQSVNAAA